MTFHNGFGQRTNVRTEEYNKPDLHIDTSPAAWGGQTGGRTDRRTNKQTNKQTKQINESINQPTNQPSNHRANERRKKACGDGARKGSWHGVSTVDEVSKLLSTPIQCVNTLYAARKYTGYTHMETQGINIRIYIIYLC